MKNPLPAVVAGHICLDMLPRLDHLAEGAFHELFRPGHVVTTGPAVFCTGGTVSNTGLSLFKLGVPVRLIAKVGADPFGTAVRELVARFDPALANGIATDPTASTSYTVIISPPGVDRIFLHSPGANDVFSTADINWELVRDAALFHFGYPPDMRRMYVNGGVELEQVFRQAKATGVTTSLDTASPDPASEAGRADWRGILERVLPFVDVFLPSFGEILYMLHRQEYEALCRQSPGGDCLASLTPERLSALGSELVEMGAGLVVIKLGGRGLYLRTAGVDRLAAMGRAAPTAPDDWKGQQLWAPCFRVRVAGTTGAGDTTIAGFLSALLRGLSPRESLTAAVAVGACCVEAPDSLSGVQSWEQIQARISAGWERLSLPVVPGWTFDQVSCLWVGPLA